MGADETRGASNQDDETIGSGGFRGGPDPIVEIDSGEGGGEVPAGGVEEAAEAEVGSEESKKEEGPEEERTGERVPGEEEVVPMVGPTFGDLGFARGGREGVVVVSSGHGAWIRRGDGERREWRLEGNLPRKGRNERRGAERRGRRLEGNLPRKGKNERSG